MKHLEFTRNYGEALLKGIKRATIRKWTNLRVGDEVYVHCGGKIIGKAKITDIEKKKLEEITDEDAKLDGFQNREELLNELKKLGYEGYVYLIKFDFEPMDSVNPHNMYYGDADLEEIAKKALQNLELSERDRKILELFLRSGSIRKAAAKLGGWKKRGEIRKVLRRCYNELKKKGLVS